MTLRLRNSWDYEGNDRWRWTAFIDDDGSGDLARVKYVDYVLHETFKKPILRINLPKNGFALTTAGWGTFELKAFAHMNNGKKIGLTHELQLEYKPKTGTSD